MTALDVNQLIESMAADIKQRMPNMDQSPPLMVGIHTGGAWVAEHLHQKLGLDTQLSRLNISFYRDDFTRIGMHPQVLPSQMLTNIEGRSIILVDDVLYTGRTIRAALNEIFDYGRPQSILLATLVERDGRELPIQADVVGTHVDLDADQQIKLTGPEPLALSIISSKQNSTIE